MNNLFDLFSPIFVMSERHLALYIPVILGALLLGAFFARWFFRYRSERYIARTLVFLGIATSAVLALLVFQHVYIHIYPLDDRCPNAAYDTVYLPLIQDDVVRTAAHSFPISAQLTCEDLVATIENSDWGWTWGITIAIHLLLGAIIISCLVPVVVRITRILTQQQSG